MATPQLLSRKAAGVLPVSPAHITGEPAKPAKTKTALEGEKVVVRRLPPGLTEDEFVSILGDEWRAGKGKVGWFSYQAGKVSREPSPAKPSRPARAYLHVLRQQDLVPLADAVRNAAWEDAKETWTSLPAIFPPTAERAIYKKIPSGKRRSDGRQGTIDQDPEFMDFLEALANPSTGKDHENEAGATTEEGKPAKATSTPLIDYLREKKANKAKEAANAKAAKHSRHESQGGKGKGAEESKKKSKSSDKSADKPKETVKILTKKAAAAAAEAADAAKAVAEQITGGSKDDGPKSRRAGIAHAARILQRDLGLSPGNAHRRARQQAAQAENEAKANAAKDGTAATTSSAAAAAAATTPQSPTSAQPPAPATSKTQAQAQSSSSRGPRGKKNAAASAAGDTSKGKSVSEATDGSAAAPAPTPKILLKKKDDSASATSAANPPAGPKASSSKAGASASGKKSNSNNNNNNNNSNSNSNSTPAPITPGATRAFVKHANPSQGVTEPLLKEAMGVFGAVTFVEIDRRKGFAYVDFSDHQGLLQAVAASPITVAQATVQVLERKEREAKKPAAASGATANSAGPSSSTAAAAASSSSAPAAPAGEKNGGTASGGGDHKRGGRRRGGRGRGDGHAKENGTAGGSKGPENVAKASAPAPTAVTSAG